MNILFVHQSMPGQFGRLAAALARAKHRVAFLTKTDGPPPEGVTRVLYRAPRAAHASTHSYIRGFEDAVLHGQATARAGLALARRGFRPDVIMAHPGWGEALYLKDVFPDAALLCYCEFFYRAAGADVGFDPDQTVDAELAARLRTRNAALLVALEACDRGISPTRWQRSVHPAEFHNKIDVIFDGIDTETVRPDPAASVVLPDGRSLTAKDQVITFVARNLEPYRGFPQFMRAVPRILANLPEAEIVIVGDDGVGYGSARADGRSWRQAMLDEIRPDRRRVHFLGPLPYADYLRVLQISSAHVYLTVPFVLSWSAMEALSAGCAVIGSRTAPVTEVIRDRANGILVDFFSPREIADAAIEAVRRRVDLAKLRREARSSIVGRYDLATCLPQQIDLLHRLAHAPSRATAMMPLSWGDEPIAASA